MKSFNKGIISSSLGSFWWGVLGTYYFQYISFIGTFEVVAHRCIWTALILFVTTFVFDINDFAGFFKKGNIEGNKGVFHPKALT